jgi:hypothetical protein
MIHFQFTGSVWTWTQSRFRDLALASAPARPLCRCLIYYQLQYCFTTPASVGNIIREWYCAVLSGLYSANPFAKMRDSLQTPRHLNLIPRQRPPYMNIRIHSTLYWFIYIFLNWLVTCPIVPSKHFKYCEEHSPLSESFLRGHGLHLTDANRHAGCTAPQILATSIAHSPAFPRTELRFLKSPKQFDPDILDCATAARRGEHSIETWIE